MSQTRKVYVGVDVHCQTHRVVILPLELLEGSGVLWKKVKGIVIGNNRQDFQALDSAIKQYASSPHEVAIAIDQTGRYSEPLVYFLQQRGYPVLFLETKGVKGMRKHLLDEENKRDETDAAGSAYLLYLRDKHGISFRISEVKAELGSQAVTLRTLVLQRLQYNKLFVQTRNRLRHLLHVIFPEAEEKCFSTLLKIAATYPTPKDILAAASAGREIGLRPKERDKVLSLATTTVGAPADIYRGLVQYLACLYTEVVQRRDELTRVIVEQVVSHPYGHILLSFPMLGHVAAATLISIIKDIKRWPSDRKLKKALGVYPVLSQSGKVQRRGRQGKEGDRHARSVLFQVVMTCITPSAPPNDFRDYYLRQLSRGKPKMKAMMATAGKLTEIIYRCLVKGEVYQYQGKYRTRRVYLALQKKYQARLSLRMNA